MWGLGVFDLEYIRSKSIFIDVGVWGLFVLV